MILGLVLLLAGLALGACVVLKQPQFGKLPEGERLARVQASPHYVDGRFQYPVPSPTLVKGVGIVSLLWQNNFGKKERPSPARPLPVVKTDLRGLDRHQDVVVWLGHSSWYIQLGGRRLLIDPVLSDHASPFSFLNKAFAGTTLYTTGDLPDIDYLLISHDHWDHLDYPTAVALRERVKQVVCPLGVGAHLEHWDYAPEKIREADWNTALALEEGFTVHVLPARHFSGRAFTRNKTLWAGFALETPERKIFFSGDSGYGPHFKEIARTFGGFDLVMLDGGQYDPRWSFMHMTPEEAARTAEELRAKALIPAHAGRFSIAFHPWDDPFKRLAAASQGKSYRLLTPKIGQPVLLDDNNQTFPHWWEGLE